jgi:two-component system cell cycle response regulator
MSISEGHTAGKTVLVVEDNSLNLKLTRGLLGILECRIIEVYRAEDALDVLQGQDVDLLLMDIQLPGMDGLAATRIIRGEMGMKDLAILGVSALAMEGDREKALEAGCSEYITKPIDTRQFLGMVRHCLSSEKCSPAEDRRETGHHGERRRVLVVDDNPTNVKLLKSMLPEGKYELYEANNGATALESASRNYPDVIFLDIMMPDMDGYEVTRRLKENSETAHIPVVLVTALDGSDDRVKGFEAGAEDVLVKPVNRIEVVSRARSMIRLGSYRRQVALREQAAGLHTGTQGVDGDKEGTGFARILAVEDNEQDLELLRAYLEGEPYEILAARTGEEALGILRDSRIDLILLDILLPDMDGFEVLETAKGMKDHHTVQTVVTTCLADLENKIRGVELGADDYLIKPVNPKELKARIKVLLGKKRYMDRLKQSYLGDIDTTIHDPLTGVYNMDFFMRFLKLELKKSERHNYSSSLIRIAIEASDQFDTGKDNLTNDPVVRVVASSLQETLREIDLIARWEDGGFAVLLPYCDKTGVDSAAVRIRELIAAHQVSIKSDPLSGAFSVNMGTATFPSQARKADEIIALADQRVSEDRLNGEPDERTDAKDAGSAVRGQV